MIRVAEATNDAVPDEPKKVVARGQGIVRSDEEIDEMTSAEAMEALMDEAAEDWRENAPKPFRGLLDTKE